MGRDGQHPAPGWGPDPGSDRLQPRQVGAARGAPWRGGLGAELPPPLQLLPPSSPLGFSGRLGGTQHPWVREQDGGGRTGCRGRPEQPFSLVL